ncbi:MAG TPA: nicotinamide-nucleotide amidohydrolase family protein [Streptosporangiaceae bacterium]|nr:nicotinamide-nucleotide amidohydrolase family protein [Streptosporangiaceae bacterium]
MTAGPADGGNPVGGGNSAGGGNPADGGGPPAGGGNPAEAIRLLAGRGLTVGTAESLTGGLVAAALTTVPGASAVFRGGIVAYAGDLKSTLLGVPADLLDRVGTVHADVAMAMALGALARMSVSASVATTGVAGPDPVDGYPVGTVHIAVAVPGDQRPRVLHRELSLAGDRDQIRNETVRRALNLLVEALMEDNA